MSGQADQNEVISELLDRPAQPKLARWLFRHGYLDNAGRLAALRRLNGPVLWWPWIERALMFLGLALVLTGIVCFFAWNWDDLPGLAKLGLVQVGIVACCGAALWKGIQTLAGQAAQTAASVLVGVFLAVFGQVYQTGADAYGLFVGWAALILPWVIMCRLSGLWLLWLAIVNLGLALYWLQIVNPGGVSWLWLLVALGLLNGGAVTLRERLHERGWTWLSVWLRWVLVPASITALSIPVIVLIVDVDDAGTGAWFSLVALAISLTLMHLQFRHRTPDLFVLTCGAACVTVLTCVIAVRILIESGDAASAFFLSGFAILGVVTLMMMWLMRLWREFRMTAAVVTGAPVETESISVVEDAIHRTEDQPTIRKLLIALTEDGNLTSDDIDALQQQLIVEEQRDRHPWFVQAVAGFGAWISCLMFLGFLGVSQLLFNQVATLVLGVLLLAASALIERSSTGTFQSQLALSGGLTGFLMLCIGAHDLVPLPNIGGVAVVSLVATLVFYGLFVNPPFRFLSCLITLGLFTLWFVADGMFGGRQWGLQALVLIETLGIGLVFWRNGIGFLEPAGYAFAVVLPATLLMTLVPVGMVAWPSALIQVIAQVWLIHTTAVSTGVKRSGDLFGVPAAGTALLGLLSAPGLLAATGLVNLGHLERNVILKGLGLIFLPVYVIAFYYNLATTLLVKSFVLIGTGVVLWMIRWYLSRRIGTLELVS